MSVKQNKKNGRNIGNVDESLPEHSDVTLASSRVSELDDVQC